MESLPSASHCIPHAHGVKNIWVETIAFFQESMFTSKS